MMRKHMIIRFGLLSACIVLFNIVQVYGQVFSGPQLVSSTQADTWVAIDDRGRPVPAEAHEGIRDGRFVGIFYFLWHGAHGYDTNRSSENSELGEILEKLPSDTVSPYNITEILDANPDDPKYGPLSAWHHWAEPYFGYYLSDDEWVIRKHGQLLADAGVDVMIFDVTNAFIYLNQVSKIVEVFRKMRKEGQSTPRFAFMVNAAPKTQVRRLYDHIYEKELFKDLWFYWKGKPLMLAPEEGFDDETREFFTQRQSWAFSAAPTEWDDWFGNGHHKWTWVDQVPQAYGWSENDSSAEQISVSIAQHAIYHNVGRSHRNGRQPDPESEDSGAGLYFEEQWERALAVDPEFIFITGWNEWISFPFIMDSPLTFDGKPLRFINRQLTMGDVFFIDCYNDEYSRDAEPVKGLFGDNYYYQMVSNIRKFKGARERGTYHGTDSVIVDGQFEDWKTVEATYYDDRGDVYHRRHAGWGSIAEYRDESGRNDFVLCKTASDSSYIYFYVKTADNITSPSSKDWMRLFIGVRGEHMHSGWQGFHFLVNREPINDTLARIDRITGNPFDFSPIGTASFHLKGNEMEVKVAKEALNIAGDCFEIDFKWVDNVPLDGDAMHWLDKGDTAPNARFRYRFGKSGE
ncbi:hypothetical protein [Parapedobacter sp. 10938]|uniref:hypothetical protein n=1 Tax=Parapedobacter flavus TaxID=3110225 RepID=UPI002DB7D981|nr:hypothetical protein [Parapedobacter sp. 10938]MEC3878461.1 hypothetical protein [Parapedobacter sp. 10938]